jgi:alkanesulfonate monooxygenase SsuD/methylene tetrahydromethanopterin reductase-like flavin-dependent oxidoreductase (luciferase family)
MHYGIHLPHAGERATPILIRRFAVQAEALGIADVWVSEHIILPRTQFLRPLPFYEPVLTLTWVAAVTERVNLGTSVLVLPLRHPIPLAKELATLQNLSALMRAVWTQDPVTFATRHIPAEITDMTMTPLPVAPIPLWIGGSSDAALRRAIRWADGWHGSRETPEQTAPIVQRLRAERPDRDFTISMRVNWNGHDLGELRDRIAAYEAAGVQHILVASDLLRSAEIDNWDGILDGVGRLVAESRM